MVGASEYSCDVRRMGTTSKEHSWPFKSKTTGQAGAAHVKLVLGDDEETCVGIFR
jgi:hypothetical protein